MKKLISILTMAVLGIAMFTACSDDDNDSPNPIPPDKNPKDAKITMVTSDSKPYLDIETFKEGDIVTIDFGDGKVEEFKSDEDCDGNGEIYYSIYLGHEYTDGKAKHTIVIEAENVKELGCGENELTSLDLRKCPALTRLYCGDNQLTSLDVSKCPALTWLSCRENKFTSLDVSKCTALTNLYCGGPLTSLDVSKCTALTELYCTDSKLTSLDVSGCTALTELYCYNNELTSLDASGCTALTDLSCSDNQLTSLEVSKNTALTWLLCSENKLTSTALNKIFTDLPQGKTWIEYGNEEQSKIRIRNNPGTETCDRSIAEKKDWIVKD